MSMFNFLFDGTIQKMGETVINYAAPIQSPAQQYQLAIQHHRNDEARHFLQSGQVQMGNIADTGVADIHVACRFNNQLILELLISQGLDINLRDKANNTPLHFASKYGNIDICRYLVGLNCLTGSRNSSNQSPYDVAESHIVRQYLLPLQFQEEAKHPDAIAQQQLPQDPFALGGRSSVPTNVAPPPVFSPPSGGGGYSSQQAGGYPMHNRYVAYPGMEDNSGPQQQSSPAPQQYMNQSQPISNTQSPAMQRYQPPAANKSVSHMIQPDGFGSSQTDVRLQQKYGNVKEQVYISPPPVGVMGAPVAPVPTTPAPTDSVQPGMTRSVSNPDNSAPLPIPTGSSSAHLSSTLNNISISGSGVNSGHHSAPTSNSGQQVSPPTPSLPLPTPSQRSSTTSVSKSPRSTAATSKVDNSSIPVTHDTPKPPVPTVFVPPTPAVSSAPLATTATTTATTTTVHKPSSSFASSSIIKPDGFGSSQTDVRLQQKYGNVKEQVFISPPPVGGIGGQPTASVPLMNPYGGKQQSSAPVVSAPPPVFYQQPQNQSQIPQSVPVPHQTGVQSNTPPLPYSSSTGRSQQVMSTSDDGSNFSTIDLDSNSSAMM